MAPDTPLCVDAHMLWPEIGHPALQRPQISKLAEEEGFGPSVSLSGSFLERVRCYKSNKVALNLVSSQ